MRVRATVSAFVLWIACTSCSASDDGPASVDAASNDADSTVATDSGGSTSDVGSDDGKSCGPACLRALFDGCPIGGACRSATQTDGTLGLCYATGTIVTRVASEGGTGLEGTVSKDGHQCYRWQRTAIGLDATITYTASDGSVVVLRSQRTDGGPNVNTIECGGVTTNVDDCFSYLADNTAFIGTSCPPGACAP